MTLVLSFSSNAAQEICGQASVLPGGAAATDVRAVWAGTFHSFALRLLGQYPYLGTGLSRFTIADPSDQHAAMQAALAELKPTAGGGASTHKLLRRLSVWKEQGLDERRVAAMLRDRWDGDTSTLGGPSRNARFAHDDREERLASAVYPVYQRCLRARGKVRALLGGIRTMITWPTRTLKKMSIIPLACYSRSLYFTVLHVNASFHACNLSYNTSPYVPPSCL